MTTSPFQKRAAFVQRYAREAVRHRKQGTCQPLAPAPHRPDPTSWRDDRVTLAWLGHSSLLLNFYGTWLLTDPALRPRIGVSMAGLTMGPKRLIQPALRARELPRPHGLLLSHAHMDHLDLPTLRQLPRSTRTVSARGCADLLGRFHDVEELDWGGTTGIDGVRIEALPGKHWGARMMTDTWRGYCGFLLQKNGRTVVFTGDTAYTDAYAPLRDRIRVDLAILPIGAYDPWIANHANPEEAWSMGRQMGAEHVLPVHHSTFRLSREPMDEPIRRFVAAAGDERWRVAATEVGETWVLPED